MITSAALRLVLIILWERVRRVPAERSRMPAELRLTLERLGPTFVKAGQALSLRQDLLPPHYLDELAKLQFDVAPFPAAEARAEIEKAFGESVETLFSEFDEHPLAAASIAQVHSAALPDGHRVIVKVRRPGIKRRIDRDMRSLIRRLRFLSTLVPFIRQFQPARLAEEIWSNLRRETDFLAEAQAMKRFAQAFPPGSGVEVPAVIENLVTENVLVQERKEGRMLGDAELAIGGPEFAGTLVEAYLQQIFVLGFFHGDPHPGNLFFTSRGGICFHDFGLVGQLDRATRREVAMFVQAFVHQDARWMLDSAAALGLIAPGDSAESFIRGIEEILGDYAALPIKEWSISALFLRVSRLGPPGSVRIPYDLLVLIRVTYLLENALRKLDPDMNLIETLASRGKAVMETLAQESSGGGLARARYEAGFALEALPAAIASGLSKARRTGFHPEIKIRLAELESVRAGVERTGNRLAVAIVTLGLFVGASLLMQHSIGPKIMGVPALALAGYLLALWYTVRLVRAIARAGHL